MSTIPPIAVRFWQALRPLLDLPPDVLVTLGTTVPIPQFSETDVISLCSAVTEILCTQGPLIHVDPPVHILGDIHGNLHDLLRILNTIGTSTTPHLIFLGDYIDRGGYSVEVVIIVFTLLCMFPNDVVLLRGNHEFSDVESAPDLAEELYRLYDNSNLYACIHATFSWMPLAALIGTTHLCVHGGIGPHFQKVEDLSHLEYPILTDTDPLVEDLLWSDPSRKIQSFIESSRGRRVHYGYRAISDFLEANHLQMIIRGHQCVMKGYELFHRVLTVFSSGFYTDAGNRCGWVYISAAFDLAKYHMDAIRPLLQRHAKYVRVELVCCDDSELASVKRRLPDLCTKNSCLPGSVSVPAMFSPALLCRRIKTPLLLQRKRGSFGPASNHGHVE
jgi:protein phosphatase